MPENAGRTLSFGPMRRLRLVWLLALALTAAGWLTAHEVAYRLAVPHPHSHAHAVRETGHSYLSEYGSVALALCAAVAVFALAGLLLRSLRGTPEVRGSLTVFAVLPPAGFVLQEHLERVLAPGSVPADVLLEPAVLLGLLLQLPFALAALALASALLLVADTLVRTLKRPPPLLAPAGAAPVRPTGLDPPRVAVLALGYGQRAPPPLAAQ
jgi:hypothetical protein